MSLLAWLRGSIPPPVASANIAGIGMGKEAAEPAPPAMPDPKEVLIVTLREQVRWLQAELHKQHESHELREAEIRAQLVALANSNAYAMSAHYGPERPSASGANGSRRVVLPPGFPAPTPPTDAPAVSRPWDNSLMTEDHVDLGRDFADVPDLPAPSAGPAGSADEEALVEATIERAAKEREAARLGSAAPERAGPEEE